MAPRGRRLRATRGGHRATAPGGARRERRLARAPVGARLLGSGLRRGEGGTARGLGSAGARLAPGRGLLAGGVCRGGRPVVAPAAPRSAHLRPTGLRRRGRGRVAGRAGGGAGPSRGTLRAARTRAHGLARPGALRGDGGRRAPGGGGVGPGRAASGPRGAAGGAGRHRPRPPSRARSTSRRPSAWCGRCARCRGGRGARSGPRGLGRGSAPSRARPRGVRCGAAGRAGHDDPASDGRRPGGRARATRPFEWEGLWYGPTPAVREFTRLERVRSRQGSGGLSEALLVCHSAAAKKPDPCAAALGEALVSLAYAAAIGEPDGPALAGSDPSLRHDFGAEPWALPDEVVGPGEPRHVRGSLLGLERALARLFLDGLAGDALPVAPPVIDAVQRRSLAVSAVLSNPRDLTDADRDAISAAIESGRARVAALRAGDARWRCGPRCRPRPLAGPCFRVAARAPAGRPGELLLARGATEPRSARRAAVRCVGCFRRSRRGPRPAPARARRAGRSVRAPATAGARVVLRGPGDSGRGPPLGAEVAGEPLPLARVDAPAGPLRRGPTRGSRRSAGPRRVGARAGSRSGPRRGRVARGARTAAAGFGARCGTVKGRRLALAALVSLVGGLGSPALGASLRIEEPAPGVYVSGPVTLRARVEPEGLTVLRLDVRGGWPPRLRARVAAVGVPLGRGHGRRGPQHPRRRGAHGRLAPRGHRAHGGRGLRARRGRRGRPGGGHGQRREGTVGQGPRPRRVPGLRGRPASGRSLTSSGPTRRGSWWWRWT